MRLLNDLLALLHSRDPLELLRLFWFFILFDFTRYVLMDTAALAVFFWKRRQQQPARDLARARLFHESPLVSVIAPGKNEGRHIPRLAASLRNQTYRHIEIIIVDDGSNDDTVFILRRLQAEGSIDRYFRAGVRGGKASAANLALLYSSGKYVVHLDADSHLREDSIEKILIPFYLDPMIGAVGGDIRVYNINESLAASMQAAEYMKSLSTGRVVNSVFGILRIVSGAYGAFRRDILERIRGWDVGPGLDGDITLKIRKLGFQIHHESSSVCYTNVPDTFRKLAKQRYRWDRSLVRFRVRKHRDLLSIGNRNFRILNFLAVVDNLFFNIVLNFKWWIYVLQIVFFDTDFLPVVFCLNYILYLGTNTLEFILACLLFGKSIRRSEVMLFLYLPLMPIYTGFYLRFVRTFAYVMEFFFKASYEDAWNPWKVSQIAKREESR